MIIVHSVALSPNPVHINEIFSISVDVEHVIQEYRWSDLQSMTWDEIKSMTWGDLFTYRNPDHRNKVKYCGTFYSGQDFAF